MRESHQRIETNARDHAIASRGLASRSRSLNHPRRVCLGGLPRSARPRARKVRIRGHSDHRDAVYEDRDEQRHTTFGFFGVIFIILVQRDIEFLGPGLVSREVSVRGLNTAVWDERHVAPRRPMTFPCQSPPSDYKRYAPGLSRNTRGGGRGSIATLGRVLQSGRPPDGASTRSVSVAWTSYSAVREKGTVSVTAFICQRAMPS